MYLSALNFSRNPRAEQIPKTHYCWKTSAPLKTGLQRRLFSISGLWASIPLFRFFQTLEGERNFIYHSKNKLNWATCFHL